MRVRVAYISSLGTTAILVAAALTLLIVVGTIVAFTGWPGSADSSGVQSVPLTPTAPPARAALVRRAPVARHVVRTAPSHPATRRGSTAGLVKAARTRKQIVPGLIMVPTHAALPMAPHPLDAAPTPPYQAPAPAPATPRDAPSGEDGANPVPDTGGAFTIPSLNQGVPTPPDPVATLVDGLLSGGPPPPMQVLGLQLP
jgi:hypothetical protein